MACMLAQSIGSSSHLSIANELIPRHELRSLILERSANGTSATLTLAYRPSEDVHASSGRLVLLIPMLPTSTPQEIGALIASSEIDGIALFSSQNHSGTSFLRRPGNRRCSQLLPAWLCGPSWPSLSLQPLGRCRLEFLDDFVDGTHVEV